ncbi:MAG: hypothetical protein FWH52_03195 [Synergistaceae bacterium]|nr:hypothetical protein [Synergistaceae bacterium]
MKKVSCVIALALLLLIFSFMGAQAERVALNIKYESCADDVSEYVNSMQQTR